MAKRQLFPLPLLGVVLSSLFVGLRPVAARAASSSDSLPYSTPPGITLINVAKIFPSTTAQYLWRRLGDANGEPLYTYDNDSRPNESTCTTECAKEFPPLIASPRAVAFGEWSLVKRDGRIRQWAYQGK